MRFFWIKTLVASTFVAACKPTPPDPKTGDGGRQQFSDLYATGQTELRQRGNYFYALFKKDYERRLETLPLKGEVENAKLPYAGSWYPQKTGGTSRDSGAGNVLQKYDKSFHKGENKAVKWEQDHHTVSPTDASVAWSGHCNGFSAASSRHLEPKNSVKRGEETFSPKDIKALLAEVHMSAKFYFLGGNRCGLPNASSLPKPSAREDVVSMGECDDVNPGTFHTAVANWIGIQKHALIMDLSSKEQVWNYPHFKYESNLRKIGASEAMTLVTGVSESIYRFNPSAVSFRSVATTTTYSRAFEKEYLAPELKETDKVESRTYTYVLELDAEGRIIGGEWVGESQNTHPDFIWIAFEPVVGDGSDGSANPHVNPTEVIKLWAESVGQDPNNPTLDLKEPTLAKEWGRFPKFDLAINNGRSGSVFLGMPQEIRLERKEALHGDVSVELILDGKSLSKKSEGGTGNVVISTDQIRPGIHSLEVKWSKGAETVDVQRVKLHAL